MGAALRITAGVSVALGGCALLVMLGLTFGRLGEDANDPAGMEWLMWMFAGTFCVVVSVIFLFVAFAYARISKTALPLAAKFAAVANFLAMALLLAFFSI